MFNKPSETVICILQSFLKFGTIYKIYSTNSFCGTACRDRVEATVVGASTNVILYLYTHASPSQLTQCHTRPELTVLVTSILIAEVRVRLDCLPPSRLVQVFLVVRERKGVRVGRSIMLTHLLA